MNNIVCSKPGCDNPAKVKFCSRSCAASHNNSIIPRRKPEHKCAVCLTPINARRKYCSTSCKTKARPKERPWSYVPCDCGGIKQSASKRCQTCKTILYEDVTLGELRLKAIRHAQVYNALRQRSRKIAKNNFKMECAIDGYNIHVDVCHIIALHMLPDSATVSDASDPNNFVLLCKRCHWELDHGYLNINSINRPSPLPQLAPRLGVEPS